MVSLGSTALKLFQTFLYAIAFCCSAAVLGIYAYFLAILRSNDLPIDSWKKAVEGISGAAALYTAFAVILTCFLGGISFFAVFAIVLNLLFAGGFIAVAVLARDGAHSCNGNVNTPIGDGPSSSGDRLFRGGQNNNYGFDSQPDNDYNPDLGFACRVNRTAFVVAIVAALLFLVMMGLQLILARKHKEDKQFQAAPGSGKRRFWQRKSRSANPGTVESAYGTTKPESHSHTSTYEPHDSSYTGSSAMPGSHASTTYDSTGRPIANPYSYQAGGPTGPYTNY